MPFPLRRRESRAATGLAEPEAASGRGNGRLAEIAELTRKNRQHRDPALETRLVALRNEAFTDLGPLARSARPDPGDLFPEASGPPEVSGRDLTVDHVRSGIGHHGSLIVRGLIEESDVARLVADIDRAFDAQAEYAASQSEQAPWYARFKADASHQHMEMERWSVESNDGVLAADSPRTLFDLIDAYQSAPIGGILATGTEGADLNWSIGQPVVDRAAAGTIVRPVFRPGDALLFDELLVHRTGVDPTMMATRHAIEAWFFAPSSFPEGRIPLVF